MARIIKKVDPALGTALALRKEGKLQEAIDVLEDLVPEIHRLPKPGPQGPLSFQHVLERSLHMFMSDMKEQPSTYGANVNLVFFLLGNMYLDLEHNAENLETAVKYLSEAMDYNPTSASTVLEFTECFKIIRDWDTYEKWTRNAFLISFLPTHLAKCYRNMGYLLYEKDDPETAATLYHLSTRYENSDVADNELQFLEEAAGKKFPHPGQDACKAVCEKLEIPYGPSPHVRGLIRGHAKAFIMAGLTAQVDEMLDLMQGLHPGEDLRELIKTPKEDPK